MAEIQYPSSLPVPVRIGYGIDHVDPTTRVRMQSGRTRQRRIYTSAPSLVTVTWRMTEAEARVFEAFYRHTLMDGTKWFDCPIETPMGRWRVQVRFSGMYSGPQLVGPSIWDISGSLETIDRLTIAQDITDYPELLLGMPIIDFAVNREWPK